MISEHIHTSQQEKCPYYLQAVARHISTRVPLDRIYTFAQQQTEAYRLKMYRIRLLEEADN